MKPDVDNLLIAGSLLFIFVFFAFLILYYVQEILLREMNRSKVDFKTGFYFPTGLIFAGLILMVGGLAISISLNIIGGIIFILIGLILITTHYRLEVDFESRRYRDYVWLLGFKIGASEPFEKIEYIFVKKSKMSQNMNSLISSRTFTKDVFDAYLKLDGHETIHLLSKENKSKLVSRLTKIADMLQVKIIDYSLEGTQQFK